MMILPLTDNRWSRLMCRAGDGQLVAAKLTEILAEPNNPELLQDLTELISTESTTWPAGYAAAPHIVKAAQEVSPGQRKEHALLLGLLATYSGAKNINECPEDCPTDLFESYRDSLITGREMLLDVLRLDHDSEETRWLMGALFSLLGHPDIGDLVMSIDCGCPNCGEPLLEKFLSSINGLRKKSLKQKRYESSNS